MSIVDDSDDEFESKTFPLISPELCESRSVGVASGTKLQRKVSSLSNLHTYSRSESTDALRSRDKWAKYLSPTESMVLCGLIEKRGKHTIWSQKRQLLLTNYPRFLYINPETFVVKGEIRWSDSLRVELKDEQWFSVHTPKRIYRIKSLSTR